MLTLRLVSSKVRIKYPRCPCNKLWRRFECLNIYTYLKKKAIAPKISNLLNDLPGQTRD